MCDGVVSESKPGYCSALDYGCANAQDEVT